MVKVIKLTKAEKQIAWKIPYIFSEKDVTPQSLKEFSRQWGLHTRFLEIMFWQLDTLYILSHTKEFVWKGGTCVQSYLDPEFQRYSVDIDLNTSLDRKGVISLVEKLNDSIINDGHFVELDNVRLGVLEFHSENRVLGVLNFFRLVPTKHGGEYSFKGETKILGVIPIRIQINYRYYMDMEFTALNIVHRRPGLAPSKILSFEYAFPHSSQDDLLADKLLTMVEAERKHKARMRIKDVYDIATLLMPGNINYNLVKRKIMLVLDKWHIDYDVALESIYSTLNQMAEYELEVLGLRGSVGHKGFLEIINNWKAKILEIITTLRDAL